MRINLILYNIFAASQASKMFGHANKFSLKEISFDEKKKSRENLASSGT